jgi:hypothetical protein
VHELSTGLDSEAVHKLEDLARSRGDATKKGVTNSELRPSPLGHSIGVPRDSSRSGLQRHSANSFAVFFGVSASWREIRFERTRSVKRCAANRQGELTRVIGKRRRLHAQNLLMIDIRGFAEIINAPIASGTPFQIGTFSATWI